MKYFSLTLCKKLTEIGCINDGMSYYANWHKDSWDLIKPQMTRENTLLRDAKKIMPVVEAFSISDFLTSENMSHNLTVVFGCVDHEYDCGEFICTNGCNSGGEWFDNCVELRAHQLIDLVLLDTPIPQIEEYFTKNLCTEKESLDTLNEGNT